MNAFAPFDHSSHAQMTLSQTTVPLIKQPEQVPSSTSTNLVDILSGGLLAAVLACIWVAYIFFHIGMKAGQRQVRDRTVVQLQQIQTLERIWQIPTEHKD